MHQAAVAKSGVNGTNLDDGGGEADIHPVFHFVSNQTTHREHKPYRRNDIQSHAMREYWRRRRLENSNFNNKKGGLATIATSSKTSNHTPSASNTAYSVGGVKAVKAPVMYSEISTNFAPSGCTVPTIKLFDRVRGRGADEQGIDLSVMSKDVETVEHSPLHVNHEPPIHDGNVEVASSTSEPNFAWNFSDEQLIGGYIKQLKAAQQYTGSITVCDTLRWPEALRNIWTVPFQDPALLHATVFVTTVHLETIELKATSLTATWHKDQTCRIIQSRLNDPVQATTDATIGAMLCLTSSDWLTGNMPDFISHMNVLDRIISTRGGLERLGFDGLLAKVYSLYSLMLGTIQEINRGDDLTKRSPLRRTLQPESSTPSLSVFRMDDCTSDPALFDFSKATLACLNRVDMYLLFAESDDACPEGSATGFVAYISSDVPFSAGDNAGDPVYASCRWATMLYSTRNQKCSPVIRCRNQKWTQQLKIELEKTNMNGFWQPLPAALLWCLVVGMISARDMPERPWFVSNVIKMSQIFGSDNWGWVEDRLRTFCWTQREI